MTNAASPAPSAPRPFQPRKTAAGKITRVLLLAGLTLAAARAADFTAPAKNWVLPLFTKEGFRLMTARGSEARATTKDQFDVVDLNLTLFSSDATMHVDTILLSPSATFLPDAMMARGEKTVRFIRDDLEASGRRWVYDHREKNISLDGEVHVIFHAELKELF